MMALLRGDPERGRWRPSGLALVLWAAALGLLFTWIAALVGQT
jgi:hypothetical protein